VCKRPEAKLRQLLETIDNNKHPIVKSLLKNEGALRQVEIELNYEGYIKRQKEMVERIERLENTKIPLSFKYSTLNTISCEGREKLEKIKPRSIGQASRISGVSPSDISVLLVYLKN
jgi:tRNA uridine 5-carboxymethylaminomethyl modification enzyme